jgi:hypothetical protein
LLSRDTDNAITIARLAELLAKSTPSKPLAEHEFIGHILIIQLIFLVFLE